MNPNAFNPRDLSDSDLERMIRERGQVLAERWFKETGAVREDPFAWLQALDWTRQPWSVLAAHATWITCVCEYLRRQEERGRQDEPPF